MRVRTHHNLLSYRFHWAGRIQESLDLFRVWPAADFSLRANRRVAVRTKASNRAAAELTSRSSITSGQSIPIQVREYGGVAGVDIHWGR